MNNNQERKKGSATPWLLGAGALGLGGLGLALASKGKAKTGSVVKKAAAIDMPQPKPQVKVDVPKPQPSIKDELEQIKNQAQNKTKSANMQDELGRMRQEAPKPKAKPADMEDELGRIRSEQPKPQPSIKEEVAALQNPEPKQKPQPQPKVEEIKEKVKYRLDNNKGTFDDAKTYKSGASGYGGLSKQDRRAKLEKRRSFLNKSSADDDIRRVGSTWRNEFDINDKTDNKYDFNPLRKLGTRTSKDEKLDTRASNKRIVRNTIYELQKSGIEYSYNLYLLCDL